MNNITFAKNQTRSRVRERPSLTLFKKTMKNTILQNKVVSTSISLTLSHIKQLDELEIRNLSEWVRLKIEQEHQHRKTTMQ